MNKHNIIKTICDNLDTDKEYCLNKINNEYPFEPIECNARYISTIQKTGIFMRDAFIDRYSGDKLIFPPVLRLISQNYPKPICGTTPTDASGW